MDAADKVAVLGEEEEEEEEEEEKEHFFTDLAPADELAAATGASGLPPPSDASVPAPASGATATSSAGASTAAAAGGEQERRAQVGASPYLAPFTPLGSPSRPKTPSSAGPGARGGRAGKPQLVPVRGGGGVAFGAGRGAKDDVVAHLPPALAEALAATVQTLDKLILGVEDFRADQLGFLYDKVTQYVELLQKVDASAAGYDALIPLQVLEAMDSERSNPELFTRAQLDKCQDESARAAGKAEALGLLKAALEGGMAELGRAPSPQG